MKRDSHSTQCFNSVELRFVITNYIMHVLTGCSFRADCSKTGATADGCRAEASQDLLVLVLVLVLVDVGLTKQML